jgi:hypothetical protein
MIQIETGFMIFCRLSGGLGDDGIPSPPLLQTHFFVFFLSGWKEYPRETSPSGGSRRSTVRRHQAPLPPSPMVEILTNNPDVDSRHLWSSDERSHRRYPEGYFQPAPVRATMIKKKTQRVTLDLGEHAARRLERLQDVLDVRSMVGVIQLSLQLMEYVADQMSEGREFLSKDKDGNLERIAFLGINPGIPSTAPKAEADPVAV